MQMFLIKFTSRSDNDDTDEEEDVHDDDCEKLPEKYKYWC